MPNTPTKSLPSVFLLGCAWFENLIGEFKEHDQYNGFFCQSESKDWHLEFTSSDQKAKHQFDEDDLLVFYIEKKNRLFEMLRNLRSKGSPAVKAINPWW